MPKTATAHMHSDGVVALHSEKGVVVIHDPNFHRAPFRVDEDARNGLELVADLEYQMRAANPSTLHRRLPNMLADVAKLRAELTEIHKLAAAQDGRTGTLETSTPITGAGADPGSRLVITPAATAKKVSAGGGKKRLPRPKR